MKLAFGVFSKVSRKFVFGIREPSKTKARKALFNKIGNDALKWRFVVKEIKHQRRNVKMAKLNGTKVTTNEVRFSYAHVFEPHAMDGNDPKYSVSILIPKSDTETVQAIEKAIEAAKTEGKDTRWNGKIPANLKLPLRDGDVDRPDDEAYVGHWFVNASSKTKPGVVKKGSAGLIEITDETDFYSGCYGLAAINFYAFNVNGNRGIACGLNNLLFTRDGEAFGGRTNPEEDFADFIDVDDAPDFLD